MVSASDISKYIVDYCYKDSNAISNLKLQKIMYMLQIEFNREYKKQLIDDDFEAWPYGPVIPKVYYDFCQYGGMDIEKNFDVTLDIETIEMTFINNIIERYKEIKPWDLVEITHRKGGAWDKIFNNGAGYKFVIPFELIADE